VLRREGGVMDIRVRFFKKSCIIDVAGEIDLYNAFRLEDTVCSVMEKKVCAFIFNLKRVKYIDSSGVGALLSINAMLTKNALPFRIVAVPPAVMKVMELTRLVGFLPLEKTELEALDSLVGRKKEQSSRTA
jgi:anti-sigma B factor antagonist